jgi:hypothetical protein
MRRKVRRKGIKPAASVKSLRLDLKVLQSKFDEYHRRVTNYSLEINTLPLQRRLMSIEPANVEGRINGLTIPELVMLVNLSEGTGECIVLETENNKRDLLVIASKKAPRVPMELL